MHMMQAYSPLRRTPQPESIDWEHHSHRGRVSCSAEQNPSDREATTQDVGDRAAEEETASVPRWLSTATGSTASWQLPPGPAAPSRSPRLSARASVFSPGPLRFSYREAAAASAARRSATRQPWAVQSEEVSADRLPLACPPLEACELSPEPRARAGRRASAETAVQLASAGAAVGQFCGDDDGSSPLSLRKRFGGFRACESLPAAWPRDEAAS